MESREDAQLLADITQLIGEIPSADHPYWASMAVRRRASDSMTTSVLACRIDEMWAALQDWYELRNEPAEALRSIRQAAAGWPGVKDDPVLRDRYFERWRRTVRAAFERPAGGAPPRSDTVIGRLEGRVVDYSESAGVGFIRADEGGPTYFFRWDAIKSEAYFKTVEVGATVRFEARVSDAGERFALDVSPIG